MKIARLTYDQHGTTVTLEDVDIHVVELKKLFELLNLLKKRDC